MSRLLDIRDLLQEANVAIDALGQALRNPALAKDHRVVAVRIKNILENIRSALDYSACEISESILREPESDKPKFPINVASANALRGRLKHTLPGLETKAPAVFDVLERCQPYGAEPLLALPKLSSLVNKNKHRKLSQYAAEESAGMVITLDRGTKVLLDPNAQIHFTPSGETLNHRSTEVAGGAVRCRPRSRRRPASYSSFPNDDHTSSVLPSSCQAPTPEPKSLLITQSRKEGGETNGFRS